MNIIKHFTFVVFVATATSLHAESDDSTTLTNSFYAQGSPQAKALQVGRDKAKFTLKTWAVKHKPKPNRQKLNYNWKDPESPYYNKKDQDSHKAQNHDCAHGDNKEAQTKVGINLAETINYNWKDPESPYYHEQIAYDPSLPYKKEEEAVTAHEEEAPAEDAESSDDEEPSGH